VCEWGTRSARQHPLILRWLARHHVWGIRMRADVQVRKDARPVVSYGIMPCGHTQGYRQTGRDWQLLPCADYSKPEGYELDHMDADNWVEGWHGGLKYHVGLTLSGLGEPVIGCSRCLVLDARRYRPICQTRQESTCDTAKSPNTVM
jgi:hypothetical protein